MAMHVHGIICIYVREQRQKIQQAANRRNNRQFAVASLLKILLQSTTYFSKTVLK